MRNLFAEPTMQEKNAAEEAQLQQLQGGDWSLLLWAGYPKCWAYQVHCAKIGKEPTSEVLHILYTHDEAKMRSEKKKERKTQNDREV